jgi:hypothetical protein
LFGVDFVEPIPDQAMIVEVEPAGERDLRPRRQHHFRLGAALGGQEVATVDHRGGEHAMVDERSRTGTPWRASVDLEALGGLVAKELHGVAALGQRDALGRQPFEFDGPHLGAVLLALASLLRQLVVVKLALDAIDGAVEEVDRRPEQVLEVRFETSVVQGRDQGVEDVCDGAGDGIAFGKPSRIGLVLEGAVAIELKLVQDVVGRG